MSSSSSTTAQPHFPPMTDPIADLPPESNSIILAVAFVPGFMVCEFESADWQNFLIYYLRNADRHSVLTSIHATWVLDGQNRHKGLRQHKWKQGKKRQYMKKSKRKMLGTEKESARSVHYMNMRRYLLENDNFRKLHRVWGNLKKWRPIDYNPNYLKTRDGWNIVKNQFFTVIDSFMKHGEGLGMTLKSYIDFTLGLNERVDVRSVFQETASIRFPIGQQRFTFPGNNECVKFDADVLAAAFINNPRYGTFPKLEFRHCRYRGPEGHRDVCCLTELKFKFDINGNLLNHHDAFECKGHTNIDGRHPVAILSPMDRLHFEAPPR